MTQVQTSFTLIQTDLIKVSTIITRRGISQRNSTPSILSSAMSISSSNTS
eukprot:m.8902 g.8902  ORF g.8902 m.8902 type:complete len:50 (-) comp3293_c0_seq1:1110-1259(-)